VTRPLPTAWRTPPIGSTCLARPRGSRAAGRVKVYSPVALSAWFPEFAALRSRSSNTEIFAVEKARHPGAKRANDLHLIKPMSSLNILQARPASKSSALRAESVQQDRNECPRKTKCTARSQIEEVSVRFKDYKQFTIVELLAVITIIAILMSMLIPVSRHGARKRATGGLYLKLSAVGGDESLSRR
jgi:hypothetical protein